MLNKDEVFYIFTNTPSLLITKFTLPYYLALTYYLAFPHKFL